MNNTTNSWEGLDKFFDSLDYLLSAKIAELEVHYLGENNAGFLRYIDVQNAIGAGLCAAEKTHKEKLKSLLHDTEIAAREYDGFDEMVRDFTSHGFMAKSEARRRFNTIIEQARKETREEIKKEIEKWVSENTEISDMIHKSAILTSLLSSLTKE